MYPYNTDSVKVSLSEYPHYVKELYNPLRVDFWCKGTKVYTNNKTFYQLYWFHL